MPKCTSRTHTGIGEQTIDHERFGTSIRALAGFYRAKAAR